MPFSNPSTASGLDLDPGKYYVKLIKIEDADGSQYGPQMLWKFEVATLDGEVMLDERGFNAEWWQWTSPKISTGGKRPSKAYEWGTALLPGTDLMTLTGEEFATMVIGKKAIALIGPNENGRTVILSLSPLLATKGAPTSKAASKSSAPAAVSAPPEEPPDDAELIEAAVAQSESTAAPW